MRSAALKAMLVPIHDPKDWQRLVVDFLDCNYRQAEAYGSVSAERFRATSECVAVMEGATVIGLAEVRLKSVPLLGTGIAYVGGGPLTRRGSSYDPNTLGTCLQALKNEYIDQRGYILRILPPLDPAGDGSAVSQCFADAGFGPSPWPPPYRTIVVDINRPLADIRKTLAQKWRNGLNYAQRQNLTIRSGAEPELFDTFCELFDKFTDRKNISVELRPDFFSQVRAKMENDGGYLITLVLADGKPVAGHLGSLLGDTVVYIQGASTADALKNKASYLLHWHVIEEAHKRGLHWYDLGGIDPVVMPGVYHFKSGFGGREVLNPGPFQASGSGVKGALMPAVERLYRWTVRRSKSENGK